MYHLLCQGYQLVLHLIVHILGATLNMAAQVATFRSASDHDS